MKIIVSNPRRAGFRYPLPAYSRFFLPAVSIALLSLAPAAYAQTNNYFGTNGTLNGSVWSTNPAGPYTSALNSTGGAIINFENAATFNGNSITVAGINATANATIGTNTGTISNFSNGVITIDVGTGATLDFGAQPFTTSATAGYVKNGNGVLALSGNTYGGGFTVNSGTVILRGVNAMGGSATNTLTINGGTIAADATRALTNKYAGGITVGGNFTLGATTGLALSAANLTFTNNMTLGAATRTITIGGTGTYTLGGIISGAGGTGLTVDSTAAGTLALTGANTFDGGLTVKSGIVAFGNTTTGTYTHLGAGAVTLGDSSGSSDATLYDSFATSGNTYANALTIAAGSSNNTLAIAGNNSSINFTNTVALNNNLTLANANTGKIITFSGLLTQTSAGSPALTITNGATIAGTSATTALTGQAIFSGGVVVGTGGLTLANNSTQSFIVSTGNITSTTTGNLTFNANSTGAFTISAPSINNAGTITNSGTGTGITTISGVIGTNVTGVTQNSSTSALTLSGANTFSGGTTVSSGTLRIGTSAVTSGTSITSGPTGTGNLTLNNGVTLTTIDGTTRLIAAPTINLLGNITLNQTSGGTGRLQIAGTWDLGNGNRSIDIQKTSAVIGSGNEGLGFSQPAGFSVPAVGNGSLSLISSAATSTNWAQVRFNTTTFTNNAGLTVGDGVMLTSQNGAFFASGTGAPALTLNSAVTNGGGVLQLGDGSGVMRNAEVYSLSGGGLITNSNNSGAVATGTLTINHGNGAVFSGNITENGVATGKIALVKSGSGTQTLSGTNTYTGATTVNAGTLLIGAGGSLTSAVTVNAGTFGGSGSTTGNVTIGDSAGGKDAFIAPGNSPGTFTTTGSLSLLSDATFAFELNGTTGSVAADKLVANGVNINSSALFSFTLLGNKSGLAVNDAFTIIDNTAVGNITGTFSNLNAGGTFDAGGGLTFNVSGTGSVYGNDLTLTIATIPEPSTSALLAFSLCTVIALRRRKQS